MQKGEFEMSDLSDYIKYVIKQNELLPIHRPIYIYINKINNRLVFKIEDEQKLELHMPETMK